MVRAVEIFAVIHLGILFPAYGLCGLRRVDPEKPHYFVIGGVGLLLLAGVVVYGWL